MALGVNQFMREEIGSRERRDGSQRREPPPSFRRVSDELLNGWLQSQLKRGRDRRKEEEPRWHIGSAFRLGFQNVVFHRPSWQLYGINKDSRTLEKPRGRIRAEHNKIGGKAKIAVQKLTRSENHWAGEPQTNEESDIAAAQAASQLMSSLYFGLRFEQKEVQLGFMLADYGLGFVKTWWNHHGGRVVPDVDEAGFQRVDAEGRAQFRREGEINCAVLSPFHVVFDPESTNLVALPHEGGPRWMAHEREMTVAQARLEAGGLGVTDSEVLDRIRPSRSVEREEFEQLLQRGETEPKENDLVVWSEFYLAPDPRHPRGAFAVTVGEAVIVKADTLPYPHLLKPSAYPFPMVPFVYTPVTDGPYPMGLSWSLVNLQRQYNAVATAAIVVFQKTAKPTAVYYTSSFPTGSKPDITTQDTLEVTHPLYKPEWISPPRNPNVGNLLSILQFSINDDSGIHEASEGKFPSGDTPGISLQILGERDETQFAATMKLWDVSMAIVGSHLLGFAQTFYDTARLVRVIGENMQTEVFELSKSDLQGADIRIRPRGSRVESVAIRRSQDLQLYQAGVLFDLLGENGPIRQAAAQLLVRRQGLGDLEEQTRQLMASPGFQQALQQVAAQQSAQQPAAAGPAAQPESKIPGDEGVV